VVSGDPSEKGQDGFPINNAGNNRLSLSSPPVVSGDASEKSQEGFPINNVGNDLDGDGFTEVILSS
jgi:hypothetical protein